MHSILKLAVFSKGIEHLGGLGRCPLALLVCVACNSTEPGVREQPRGLASTPSPLADAPQRTTHALAPPSGQPASPAAAPSDPAPPSRPPTPAPEEAACGTSADCPLHDWMTHALTPAVRAHDRLTVAAMLQALAGRAPVDPALPHWASIAGDGASAALEGEWQAVHASCRGCHDLYETRYRSHHRGAPSP